MALPMVMTKNRSMDTRLCAALVMAAGLLAGCATSKNHAPVEDHGASARTPGTGVAVVPTTPTTPAEAPKPGAENGGKVGFYTVKPGDTLIRIGIENGQNWKDIVKWNGLDNPNLIEVGQVLRVVPPGTDPNAAGTKPVTTAKVETRPLGAAAAASGAASGATMTPTSAPP